MTHSLSLGLFIQIWLHNITLYKQMLYFEGSRHIFEENRNTFQFWNISAQHSYNLFKWFIYQPTNHNTILTEAIMLITLDKNLGSFCSKWMNRPLAMIIRMQGITKMHTSMEDDIFCIGYIFFYSFSYFIYLILHQTISINY